MTLLIKEVFPENKGSVNLSRKDKPTDSCVIWQRHTPPYPTSSTGVLRDPGKTAPAVLSLGQLLMGLKI